MMRVKNTQNQQHHVASYYIARFQHNLHFSSNQSKYHEILGYVQIFSNASWLHDALINRPNVA